MNQIFICFTIYHRLHFNFGQNRDSFLKMSYEYFLEAIPTVIYLDQEYFFRIDHDLFLYQHSQLNLIIQQITLFKILKEFKYSFLKYLKNPSCFILYLPPISLLLIHYLTNWEQVIKFLANYPHQITLIFHLYFDFDVQLMTLLDTQSVQIKFLLFPDAIILHDYPEEYPLHLRLKVNNYQADLLLLDFMQHFHHHYTLSQGFQFAGYVYSSVCT